MARLRKMPLLQAILAPVHKIERKVLLFKRVRTPRQASGKIGFAASLVRSRKRVKQGNLLADLTRFESQYVGIINGWWGITLPELWAIN